MSNDSEAIHGLLAIYERSLNTSNADVAASCYTADGIFMPTTRPTAAGKELRTAYANIFAAIRLEVTFLSTNWWSPVTTRPMR
jgi:ketosteroid isomerase-like protein